MTDKAKDALGRFSDILAKFGLPTVLLFLVLFYVRQDWILPANEERMRVTEDRRQVLHEVTQTNRSLADSYDRLARAFEILVKERAKQ